MSSLKKWLKLRFGIKPIERNVLYHRVTKTPWYYGDGATLVMLFGVLVVTGSFLGLTYSPAPGTAYNSLQQITFHNALGWFVRALHYWSAGMMVVVAVFHLLRQILIGGYQPPREGTWFFGVGLFVLIIVNSFTGYTLRWDERAVYAIRVALNMFATVPFIGDEIVEFVLGGWAIGANTLSRLYIVHILFVPLGIMALTGYHLYLVIIHGATTRAEREDPPESAQEQIRMREAIAHSSSGGQDFHPYTTAKSGSFAIIVFAVVTLLAYFWGPAKLYPEANFVADSIPREEWWWNWYSALIAYLPPWLAPTLYFALPTLLLLILLALPLIDRSENRGVRRRPLAVASVIFVVAALLSLSGLRIKSSWTAWPSNDLVPIPTDAELTESVAKGRKLFTAYGCNNCHAVGGHGPSVGPNLTGLEARLSPTELSAYISNPPEGVAMPAYESRLNEADLDYLVDFVLAIQTFPRHYSKGTE